MKQSKSISSRHDMQDYNVCMRYTSAVSQVCLIKRVLSKMCSFATFCCIAMFTHATACDVGSWTASDSEAILAELITNNLTLNQTAALEQC